MAGPSLRKGVSVLVTDRRIAWVRPTSDEPALPPDVRIIDAGGSTIVPGMVDAHSHLTLPGGSHWIERGADPPEELLEVAEHNGDLLGRAGVRWARDVGSPLAVDPTRGWGGLPQALPRRTEEGGGALVDGRRAGRGRPRAWSRGEGHRAFRVPRRGPRRDRRWRRLSRTRLRARLGCGREDGPPGDVPREHPGDLSILGHLRADDDVAAVRQRRGEGAHRASAGAGDRERPTGPPRRRADRDRDGFRRRVASRESPRVGGRGARRSRAEAGGGAHVRNDPGRTAPGRGGSRSNRRRRARGLLPRARRSAE